MKRISFILLLCAIVSVASAQKITHTFQDVALSDALKYIQEQTTNYNITFIYDELEAFRVTTHLQNKPIPDAIVQLAGFYPVRVVKSGKHEIYVECTHKTDLHLTGTIIDEQGQPVAYANIALLNPADSTLLSGGISNESGVFVIPIDQPNVIARISYIGYKTIYKQCHNTDLGTIRMQPETLTLKGVTVKGHRLLYTATDKGLKISVHGTPLEQFGSVSEMLTHLPLMMSNGEIAGRGKPEIYINNKKVRNEAELERLSADEILLAEIITNPGVEYGAEVTCVIKLKTIRKTGEGWSGNFSANYSQGERGNSYLNAALNYRLRNGMDFFAKGNLRQKQSIMSYPDKTELITSCIWNYDMNLDWHTNYYSWYADLGWNWDITDHHSVGFTYTPSNFIKYKDLIESDEQVRRNCELVDDIHNTTVKKLIPRLEHSLNAYYVGEIGKWNIDFSADYYKGGFRMDMEGMTDGQLNATSTTDTKNRLMAEKLTITAPVPKGDLTFGEEVSDVDRTNDFTQNGFSADSHIHQHTTTWSLYANYSMIVKEFTFNAGIRWQNELNNYYQDELRNEEMSNNYHALIPNISVNYRTGKWSHTISYKSIRNNPQYDMLLSSILYVGKYEYRTGNPYLQPQTDDRITWESQWKWIRAGLQYRYIKNRYNDFHTAYDDINHPGVMLVDFRATPTAQYYGLFMNFMPKIGIWQIDYSANFYFLDEELEPLGVTHIYNGLCMDFSFDNTITLPHSWLLNIHATIEPYYESGVYQQKAKGSLDFRVSKQFLKDKSLRVALYAYDILHTSNDRVTEYNGIGYRSESNIYRDQRRVGIDISWKFNATRSRYKGSHAGQSERNRL